LTVVRGGYPIERSLSVSVAVKPAYQLAAVRMPERNRNVLRRQFEEVDHVPTSEVPGR
jgi:hypothetical protein